MSNNNLPVAVQWMNFLAPVKEEFTTIDRLSANPLTFEKEAKFAVQIILANSSLQGCDPQSILRAVVNVAAIGISLNPAQKLAYLVPRKNVCCLDISYQGLLKIATDSRSIIAAKALVRRANDHFKWNGPFDMPDHDFDPFDSDEKRGPIIGAYTVAKLAAGGVVVDTLNLDAINQIRKASKAKDGGDNPWTTWYEQMVLKSAIKRGYKSWPKTDRLSQAEAILNEHEGLDDDALAFDGAPQPRRRTNAADIAESVQQVDDSPERQQLIAELEKLMRDKGLMEYARAWKNDLTKEQRKMVGAAEHERIKALADVTDVASKEVAA